MWISEKSQQFIQAANFKKSRKLFETTAIITVIILMWNGLLFLFGSTLPEMDSGGRLSNMCSNTGIMQNALPVLHNALCLSALRNADQLKLMESSQVDGTLPLAWP